MAVSLRADLGAYGFRGERRYVVTVSCEDDAGNETRRRVAVPIARTTRK